MYKDARIAFTVIIALMVFVVIIWGRNPSPDEQLLGEPEGPNVGADTAAGEIAAAVPPLPPAPPLATPGAPSSADIPAEDADPLPGPPRDDADAGPEDVTEPPPGAPAEPETPDEPSFPFPRDLDFAMAAQPTDRSARPTATVSHKGPPPPTEPVALADDRAEVRHPADASGVPAGPGGPPAAGAPGTGGEDAPGGAAQPLATHVVAKGDTYQSIARRYYKDSGKWRIIMKANGDIPATRLAIGKKLVIPALHPRRAVARRPAPAPAPEAPAPPGAKPKSRTYVVKKGETFCHIARNVYKKESLWRKLYLHNRSRLPDPGKPESLRAGTVIELPELAAVN